MRVRHVSSPSSFARCTVVCAAILACWATAQALDRNSPLRNYGRRVWQTDEGLPQNTVNRVLQTADGYLWIATDGGLARFDGIQFKIFDRRNTPQLHSNTINSLYQDTHGTLWISTADGLTSYDRGRWSVLTTANSLPGNDVFSVYEGPRHVLWILTAEGLAADAQGTITSFSARNGPVSGNVVSVRADANGNTWIATDQGLSRLTQGRAVSVYRGTVTDLARNGDGGIWVATQQGIAYNSRGGLVFLPPSPDLPKTDVEALLADRRGNLWIGTRDGLTLWSDNRATRYTADNGLPGNRIHKIYEDREGAIWVSTDGGVARIVHRKIDSFTTKDGLSAPLVLDFQEDREGSLWLGTDAGGLTMLRDQKFVSYGQAEAPVGENAKAVLEDARHIVWVGTDGSGLSRFSQGKFTAVRAADGLVSDTVFALANGPSGGLWIGTPDGLNRSRQGHLTRLTSADGLPDDYVRSLLSDTDGSIWIGTRHGLARWKRGTISSYTEADGLSSDFIGAMTKDKAGNLWIGTSHGLDVRKHGKFFHYTQRNGLSNDLITALYADPTGTVWIGTKGGSLDRWKDGAIFSYEGSTSLPEHIYGLVADDSGHLWISSDRGIFSAAIAALDALAEGRSKTAAVLSYGTADGMPTSECGSGGHPSAWRSEDGTLWFTTPRGITSIKPEDAKYNRASPPVVIERVSVDDASVPLSARLVVSPGHTRYEFHYAGLSFIAPQKVVYRYRLYGFDKSWIDAGTRRRAYYTNLKPGKYRFRVLAANNDGVWNETGASFYFRVRPHIYQTVWFYCVFFILVGLLGYLAYRLRMQRVELQFHATLAERNRIAREIHDTLAQGFVAVALQLEVAKRLSGSAGEMLQQHLDQALALTKSSLSEARRSIWDLRSQAAEDDFPARLAAVVKNSRQQSSAEVSLKITGAYRPLPAKVANEMLKISQEAILNAARHAQAAHIDVLLAYEQGRVHLTVADDGCGFPESRADRSASSGHFGLVGMKERAKAIGATLHIETKADIGTTILLEIVV